MNCTYDRQNPAHCEYYRNAFSIIALMGQDYAKANLRKCVSAVYQSAHPSDVPAAYGAIGGVFAEQLGLSEEETATALMKDDHEVKAITWKIDGKETAPLFFSDPVADMRAIAKVEALSEIQRHQLKSAADLLASVMKERDVYARRLYAEPAELPADLAELVERVRTRARGLDSPHAEDVRTLCDVAAALRFTVATHQASLTTAREGERKTKARLDTVTGHLSTLQGQLLASCDSSLVDAGGDETVVCLRFETARDAEHLQGYILGLREEAAKRPQPTPDPCAATAGPGAI